MRGLNLTWSHLMWGVLFGSLLRCQPLVCSTCSLPTSLCLSSSLRASIQLLSAGWCWVLVSAGLGGPSDAASRSARVKGENSENRAFWSAGEDRPALFCMLESGQGVTQGVCWGGENRWEGEREREVSATGNKWQIFNAIVTEKNKEWSAVLQRYSLIYVPCTYSVFELNNRHLLFKVKVSNQI